MTKRKSLTKIEMRKFVDDLNIKFGFKVAVELLKIKIDALKTNVLAFGTTRCPMCKCYDECSDCIYNKYAICINLFYDAGCFVLRYNFPNDKSWRLKRIKDYTYMLEYLTKRK